MKCRAVLGMTLAVTLVSGCATSITYPSKQAFDGTKSVEDQIAQARTMITDYGTKEDELAASNDRSAFTNILWGTAMVTAAVYKAPKDVLSGLAIGAGATNLTNSTFNLSGQLGVYQAATSALMCMRNEGEKLEVLRKAAGVAPGPGTKAQVFRPQAFTSQVFKGQAVQSTNPCEKFEADNLQKIVDLKKSKASQATRNAAAKSGAPAPAAVSTEPTDAELQLVAKLTTACTTQLSRAQKALRSFTAQNDKAAAIVPGRQMADQLQGLETTVKQKLRGLLVTKDPGTIKADMEKLVAAAVAEKKAQEDKGETGSAGEALKAMGAFEVAPDMSEVNARADYDAAVLGFDAALTTCRSGAGI